MMTPAYTKGENAIVLDSAPDCAGPKLVDNAGDFCGGNPHLSRAFFVSFSLSDRSALTRRGFFAKTSPARACGHLQAMLIDRGLDPPLLIIGRLIEVRSKPREI